MVLKLVKVLCSCYQVLNIGSLHRMPNVVNLSLFSDENRRKCINRSYSKKIK